jgi:transposase-like protein
MSLSSAASAQPPNEEWKKSTNPVDHCEIVSKLGNGNSYKCKYCAKQFNRLTGRQPQRHSST